MFGEVAVPLLRMMGHSGMVPSALLAGDIPTALARLRRELAAVPKADTGLSTPAANEDADTPVVMLRAHALTLMELLSAAEQQECDVLWDESAPLV